MEDQDAIDAGATGQRLAEALEVCRSAHGEDRGRALIAVNSGRSVAINVGLGGIGDSPRQVEFRERALRVVGESVVAWIDGVSESAGWGKEEAVWIAAIFDGVDAYLEALESLRSIGAVYDQETIAFDGEVYSCRFSLPAIEDDLLLPDWAMDGQVITEDDFDELLRTALDIQTA